VIGGKRDCPRTGNTHMACRRVFLAKSGIAGAIEGAARFSMDLLVRLAARAGLKPKLKLAA
jgi:hypothetical protein